MSDSDDDDHSYSSAIGTNAGGASEATTITPPTPLLAVLPGRQSTVLHECVFAGDVQQLSKLLRNNIDVAAKDRHGNTALHLSVMLGRRECTHLLLAHGAPVKVKNLEGWSPLAEAISYGDRPTIISVLSKLKQQTREHIESRRPNLVKALQKMGDFYMELKWDFQSWLPLVSRILPSDICRIHKAGSSIRLDTTLVDFNDMRWERGDITFIFRGDHTSRNSLTVLDNIGNVFQRVRSEELDTEIDDEVDMLMSTDILAAQMSTKSISFVRAQSGWFFRADKMETVAGQYECDMYAINGLVLESRKRREHLSRNDVQKNKAILESLSKVGSAASNGPTSVCDENGEIYRRASLAPPPESTVTWEQYVNAEPGKYCRLGRDIVYKESSKSFKATVAMSRDFPLTIEMLMNVLEVIAPFKHLAKLRDFVALKLPSGFPVKIDIPILPTVSAKITFQKFEFRDNMPYDLFEIPLHYVEDQTRFPDL